MKKKQGGGVEEKRKTPSAENEVKRDQEGPEKKRRARKGEENIKDVAVQRVRGDWKDGERRGVKRCIEATEMQVKQCKKEKSRR